MSGVWTARKKTSSLLTTFLLMRQNSMTNTSIKGRIYLGSWFYTNKNLSWWSNLTTKGRKVKRIRRLRDPMSPWETFVIQTTIACKNLLMHQCELLLILNSSWRTITLIEGGLYFINWWWLAVVWLFSTVHEFDGHETWFKRMLSILNRSILLFKVMSQ